VRILPPSDGSGADNVQTEKWMLLGLTFVLLRPCLFVPDWWVGTIPSRIASLIYINFD
jgi:hypothetical protein